MGADTTNMIHLTDAERNVCQMLRQGIRPDAMIGITGLSRRTIKQHLISARQKLGARTLLELAVLIDHTTPLNAAERLAINSRILKGTPCRPQPPNA